MDNRVEIIKRKVWIPNTEAEILNFFVERIAELKRINIDLKTRMERDELDKLLVINHTILEKLLKRYDDKRYSRRDYM